MLGRLKERLSRRFRNSQQGQSILLLALGFIALAAFVGLVTDISIMFVRFSTLRRAVDSASVAAAGQVREGTDYGTVALTARQYIVLHGLQPHRVWVETCETDIAEWRKDHPESANPGVSVADLMPETELCKWSNPRKLVRVVAQIDSETTFLKLIGIDDFVITASSVSETAVLDIALVLDSSKSMAEETTSTHFTNTNTSTPEGAALGVRGMEVAANPPTAADYSRLVLSNCVHADEWYPGKSIANYKWGGCCNDPGAGAKVFLDVDNRWKIYTDGTYSGYDSEGIPQFAGANDEYDAGDTLGILINYQDGDYSDLVCEPFKQVKDAARNFITRLDFVRGDRVALVTFDHHARVIPPNNQTGTPAMMTNEVDAIRTLNKYVGVDKGDKNNFDCGGLSSSIQDARGSTGIPGDLPGELDMFGIRPFSYEAYAACTSTNIGDGIRFANAALTNPETVRRNAVWVAIILSDGAANAAFTDPVKEQTALDSKTFNYFDYGFCPWYTFCDYRSDPSSPLFDTIWADHPAGAGDGVVQSTEIYVRWDLSPWNDTSGPTKSVALTGVSGPKPGWQECYDAINKVLTDPLVDQNLIDSAVACNDNNPRTRHFCLNWSNDDTQNAKPTDNPNCLYDGLYDADDYARDMADFAGLIDIVPNVPGNFIAMFSIAFGKVVTTEPTAAPLLRYVADAGDNGIIDNNLQQDWRDNGILNYGLDGTANGGYPSSFGPNDPCGTPAIEADPKAWCGQYYFAEDLSQLDAVFEAIASRLFTRIAR